MPGKNWSNVICLLLILITIFSIFYKTIFMGKPVSKVFAISAMDSLYHPQVKSAQISSPIDPCIYFFQMPTAVAIERIWKEGQVPLWNPNNACGHPIMAQIESGVFSWHQFLFPSSSEYWYNLGIIARIITAAVGSYFFAKAFNINSKFAILAGLSYGLCPNVLREIELTKATWAFPWVLLLFITYTKPKSLKNLTILSFACGLICATIHPECSFNTIMLGCLLVTVQQTLESKTAPLLQRTKIALSSITWLLFVGVCVFCVAAPVLLPFAEFMRIADCHKFGSHTPPIVSMPAFLLALAHPAMGGSTAFLGVLCLPLVALAYYKPRRDIAAVLICTPLTICVASLVGPLYQLFGHSPFNLLEPLYLQPICMLLLSCLMADGLQKLAETSQNKTAVSLFIFGCLSVISVVPILVFFKIPLNSLDWEVDKYTLAWGVWRKDTAIAACCCLLLVFRNFKKLSAARTAEVLMIASLLSQLTISRMSLPTHQSFNFEATEPILWLKKHPARILAMGRHFIIPNTNMTWGLSDLRHFNSLYPPRYLNFQALCGGRRYFATHYRYEDSLSKTIDLASVRYIASRSPVYDASELRATTSGTSTPIKLGALEQNLEISASPIYWDSDLRQALCLLRWRCSEEIKNNYQVQFAVLDARNEELWSSDIFPLKSGDVNIPEVSNVGRWAIPRNAPKTEQLRLILRVNNLWSNQPLWPLKSSFGSLKNNLVVAKIVANGTKSESSSGPIAPRRFSLEEELSDGTRIYQNKNALPDSFSMPQTAAVFAQSAEEAGHSITIPSFNPRQKLILEADELSNKSKSIAQSKNSSIISKTIDILTPAYVTRRNSNHVEILVDCPEPSYLVLTDTFYPGWKAYLNNSKEELEILRANYLFRAVKIPQGKSLVTFKYEPQSFKVGLILLGSVFSCFTTLYFYKKVKSRNSAK